MNPDGVSLPSVFWMESSLVSISLILWHNYFLSIVLASTQPPHILLLPAITVLSDWQRVSTVSVCLSKVYSRGRSSISWIRVYMRSRSAKVATASCSSNAVGNGFAFALLFSLISLAAYSGKAKLRRNGKSFLIAERTRSYIHKNKYWGKLVCVIMLTFCLSSLWTKFYNRSN